MKRRNFIRRMLGAGAVAIIPAPIVKAATGLLTDSYLRPYQKEAVARLAQAMTPYIQRSLEYQAWCGGQLWHPKQEEVSLGG